MYSRAGLSRTVTLVVALSLTAVSTGGVARAFDAAEPNSAGAIDRDRSNGATIDSEIPLSFGPWRLASLAFYDSGVMAISGNVRFEAAMTGIHAKAQHDPAAARPIEPIRKVE